MTIIKPLDLKVSPEDMQAAGYEAAGEFQNSLRILRWGLDHFKKCHAVGQAIKGMKLTKAIKYMADVLEKKAAKRPMPQAPPLSDVEEATQQDEAAQQDPHAFPRPAKPMLRPLQHAVHQAAHLAAADRRGESVYV